MKYYSTRSGNTAATGPEAILRGIAPDGGLYTPLDFSEMQLRPADLLGKPAVEISAAVVGKLFPDFAPEEMRALIERAYRGKFETDELTPLVPVGDAYVLELFRGPTSAFKDVALSVLPHLIVAAREKLGAPEEIAVLTATSGDTGKAALAGFCDVPGARVVVFYPEGGVSDVQRAQMVTQRGENVRVCAIRGNFDDAQAGVKAIFADDGENGWAARAGIRLSSANSINLGRLAPQVAYYFKAYVDLVLTGGVALGDEVNFVVPTGNFGDILAGELARRMGLPVGRLVCASNANNVLTDFIRTGRYDRRRAFHKTVSPSMDILVSSNLERYLLLASDCDFDLVRRLMGELRDTGVYEAPPACARRCSAASAPTAPPTPRRSTPSAASGREREYLLDPHTAVAWVAMERFAKEFGAQGATVVLSTASPYKFPHTVLRAMDGEGAGGTASRRWTACSR